jgi:hypothetical protein
MFVGAVTELRKATISFVTSLSLSLRPSVRPHGTIRLLLDWFLWNLIFEDYSKIYRENEGSIDIWQEKTAIIMYGFLTEFFLW